MFKALKDVLPDMIEELGISEPLMRSAVFAAWRAVAAELPAHARAARPFRYKNGTLTVEAPSSAAVHELHMRAPQLTRDVNRAVGRALVAKIEFRVRGHRPPTRAATAPPAASSPAAPRAPAPTHDAERARRLRQAIDLIENPTVRAQALAQLAASEEQESVRCEQCGTQINPTGDCPLCQAHEGQEGG